MRQLNVHDFYTLGKNCSSVLNIIGDEQTDIALAQILWPLIWVRDSFNSLVTEPCALVPSSRRAALTVIDAITSLIPEDFDEIFALDNQKVQHSWQLYPTVSAIKRFETILANDVTEMSTYSVNQVGIMRTDALIDKAYMQIAEPRQEYLLELAKTDITEAGKCLAFRISTASAFHLSRAIETGMNQYYYILTGRDFCEKEANRNWGKKTQALIAAGADERITEFLTHIRKAYRNPITHPDEILNESEALNFFGPAISAITMMLGEVKRLMDTNQTPLLEGLQLEEVEEEADRLRLLPGETPPA